MIADKSGHRSLDGLRAYEHPSTELEKAAGSIIADPKKSFKEELKAESFVGSNSGFSGSMFNCTFNFNVTYGKI